MPDTTIDITNSKTSAKRVPICIRRCSEYVGGGGDAKQTSPGGRWTHVPTRAPLAVALRVGTNGATANGGGGGGGGVGRRGGGGRPVTQ